MQLWIDGQPIGSDIVSAGPIEITIEAQAPSWMDLDRVELYENGTLIKEFLLEDSKDPYRFATSFEHQPTKDSWYVVIASGDGDMAPVFTPVEIPVIDLQLIVIEALTAINGVSQFLEPAVPIPRMFPIHPYAITNPIWVDQSGDGFDAPGLPPWLKPPIEPASEE